MSNFNAELTETVLTFTPEFSDFISVYVGVKRTWIGDGTTGDQGVLYAEMADGAIQNIGPVSSYYYALQSGYTGTFQEWVQTLLDASVNAQSAAQSASDASNSATIASGHANTATQQAGIATTKANEASASSTSAGAAQSAAEEAQRKAEVAISHTPRIANNDNWEVWDIDDEQWVDTGHKCKAEATTSYAYQNSTSGTVIPTGTWTQNPDPQNGKFLWIRIQYTWTNGTIDYFYNVSYIGVNGTGSVHSVNGLGGDVIVDGRNIYVDSNVAEKETLYAAFDRINTAITNQEIDALF